MKQAFVIASLLVLCSGTFILAQSTPKDVAREALVIQASKQKMLGNLNKAKELYNQIITENPTHSLAAYELARILLSQNQAEEAASWAKKAAELEPANPWYAILQADALQNLGKPQDAAAVYGNLLKRFPNQDQYAYKQAFLLVKANDLNGAIKVYEDLEKRIGINEKLSQLKHNIYVGQGDAKKAARELQRLADAYPHKRDLQHNLAEYYTQIGDKAAATAIYRKIQSLDPDDAKASLALSGQSVASQNDAKYVSGLQSSFADRNVALALKVGKLEPLLNKFKSSKDPTLGKEIIALLETLSTTHADEAMPQVLLGDALISLDRPGEALEKYQQALKFDETNFAYWEKNLRLLYQVGKLRDLEKTANNALDVFPNHALPYIFGAYAATALGKNEVALSLLNQGYALSSKDPALRQDLLGVKGLALRANAAESEKAFSEALSLGAPNALLLARQALAQNNAATALDLARKAAQADAQSREAKLALARALLRNNNPAEAKSKIESLLPSTDALILETYGDVLFKSGDVNAAVEQWTKAVSEGSESSLLRKKINEKQLHE
jgi:tetratricopeptide (TPR) repeat protein